MQTQSRITLRGQYRVRMPDGALHTKYVVELALAARLTPSFWGKPVSSELYQLLLIDPAEGSFDHLDPSAYVLLPGEGAELTRAPGTAELPARYSGSFCRQEMLRLLDLLASVTDTDMADAAAPVLQSRAEQLVQLCADEQSPWPQNWGDDSATAEEVHRAVIPTLLYLQEKDCHNSSELADFINGQAFGLIFGESFRDGNDAPADRRYNSDWRPTSPDAALRDADIPDDCIPADDLPAQDIPPAGSTPLPANPIPRKPPP